VYGKKEMILSRSAVLLLLVSPMPPSGPSPSITHGAEQLYQLVQQERQTALNALNTAFQNEANKIQAANAVERERAKLALLAAEAGRDIAFQQAENAGRKVAELEALLQTANESIATEKARADALQAALEGLIQSQHKNMSTPMIP
jgi:cellulose biosynthesis protein BcsQ